MIHFSIFISVLINSIENNLTKKSLTSRGSKKDRQLWYQNLPKTIKKILNQGLQAKLYDLLSVATVNVYRVLPHNTKVQCAGVNNMSLAFYPFTLDIK